MNRWHFGTARLICGLALVPIMAATATFAAFPLIDISGRALYGGRPGDMLDAAQALAAGVGIVALLVTLICGVPTLLWLRRRNAFSLKNMAIAGACLGNVPFILVVAIAYATKPAGDASQLWFGVLGAARAIVSGSIIGSVAAATPWAILGWLEGRRS